MKRIFLLAILVAVAACTVPAALFAGEPDYSRKEVIYGRKYGVALTMDVFTPKKEANGAGVIFVVSGGWFSDRGAINGNIGAFIQPLVDKGYTLFAVMHGSSPKYALPEILEDMHRSVRFIRGSAKDYGIVRFYINDRPVGPIQDLYSPIITSTGAIDLGRLAHLGDAHRVARVDPLGFDARRDPEIERQQAQGSAASAVLQIV